MAPRIGEILVRKEIITEEQLDEALKQQTQSGDFLGKVIVDLGYATEEGLLTALAEQFNTRFVSLDDVQINPAVLKLVPRAMAWEHHFMPIEMRSAIMLIAVSNPLDMWPMSVLRDKFNLAEIQTVLATQKNIEETILKNYGADTSGG